MKSRNDYRFPFSRYPALRLAFLFILGIIIHEWWIAEGNILLILPISLLLTYFLTETLSRKYFPIQLNRLTIFCYLLLVVTAGYIRADISGAGSVLSTDYLRSLEWEEVQIQGTATSVRRSSSGKYRLRVEADEVRTSELLFPEKAVIMFSMDPEQVIPQPGDNIRAAGSILPVREKRNPHDFNLQKYLSSQNILFQMDPDSVIITGQELSIMSWIYWRKNALQVIERNFDEATASIAKAMILGFKDDLNSEDRTAFARVGLSHIMAVSGLHVGFIIAPFWLIIPWLWTSNRGKISGLLLLILILFLYAGITGFSASVIRASIMAGLLTYAKLFHKNSTSINLMGVAAVIILIFDPGQLYNVGFQLSFSAVMVILIVLPVIQKRLPYILQIKWYAKPLMVVIVSLVVQFGLYPMQVYYFGEVSLISPLANALFVPLLGIIVPLAVLALLIGGLLPAAGILINYPALIFLRIMRSFVDHSQNWEWTWFNSSGGGILLFLTWICLLLYFSSLEIPKLRWKWLIMTLVCLNLQGFTELTIKLKSPVIKVIYFDVGQGDASLITTPSGKQILVDAGIWSPGYNSGRSVILPHLRAEGITKLDAVILSHPHADHIGGILDLIEQVPVERIINSGFKYDSELYQTYLEKAAVKGIPVIQAGKGDTLSIDPAVLIIMLGPDPKILTDDPNQHSVVLQLHYGNTSFLFTGDAGERQEEELLLTYDSLLQSDVLKVGHHGSRTSSAGPFMQLISPDISVISFGENNKFRHPHNEALINIHRYSDNVWNTAGDRAVELISDGKQVYRSFWQ